MRDDRRYKRGERYMNTNEFGFYSKEVAAKLDINASTLRQWCLKIEDETYEIERNDKDQRIFYERDINLLFEIKKEIEKTRNRDNAIKTVVARYKSNDIVEKTLSVNENKPDTITLSKSDLEEMLNQAAERGANMALEKFNDSIEKRDRVLLNQLSDSLEKKRLEIASAEEENQKKSIFSKWFGFKKDKKNAE